MRKRQSPIVLVTALVLIVAGVAGFNFATSRAGGNPAEQAPAPEVADAKPVGEARPGTTEADVSKSVKGSLVTSTPAKAAPTRPGMPPAGPMILDPSATAKPVKPTPNTSSTSAQWYNDESALSKEKG